MTLLLKLIHTGVHFADDPSKRRSILLSNVVSLILFGLGLTLFVAYYLWYGWSVVTIAIPVIATLCLLCPFLNALNFSIAARMIPTFMIPVMTMGISIYAKIIYYDQQEELDYFTFRFVILASCVFPAIFFSFREKALLVLTSIASFAILMLHDPLHSYFGVPYQKDILKESNYAFTNIVLVVTYGIMMGAVMFLKWTSEKSEDKAACLIKELNQINEELIEKSVEIEAQNQEILAQTENLNESQERLQKAYELIEAHKNQLINQNENLSTEILGINHDLQATNTELIKHNNELRQFSYTVSHNLRGPVASLMGLVNLLEQNSAQVERGEIHDHIRTSINRLDMIIADLSKIIDIRHDIFNIRQRIDLEREVRDIIREFKKELDVHDIKITLNFNLCREIYSVRPMVHSILYNLISNAIKYRAHTRQPEIEISSSVDRNYVIVVKDNGLGIDLKTHRENLFKLYKRFHYHTEGKGLGLYLVKLQAEALGGSVDVQSEMNRSTTFTVRLDQPENVEQQILFKSPHATIFFDARLNSTGVIWKGPISSQQYRQVFGKCLEFVKVYNTPNYIADLSDQGHVSRDDQAWMFENILPEAAQYGLKRIAGVKASHETPSSKEYLEGIQRHLASLGLEQKYFTSLEQAMMWIQTENEKNLIAITYD